MATIGAGACHVVLGHIEVFCKFGAQTGGVERGEGRHTRGFHPGVDQRDEAGDVGGIEDYHNMFHVGAVFLHVLAELLGYLGVSFQEVFAGHSGLAGSTSARHYIGCARKRFGHVGCVCEVHPLEATMAHLLIHSFERRSVWIVEADVGCEFHHHCRLGHVRPDHTGWTHDGEFFVCKEFHNRYRVI